MVRVLGREIYWYGFAWFLAMCVGTWIMYRVCRREGYGEWRFFGIFLAGYFGPVIGGRLGHCFFYGWAHYTANPVEILHFHEGGMASHGAALGLLAALGIFSWAARVPYVWSLDRIMLPVSFGGALVRVGNLMNSEIYGAPTGLPWGFEFVRDPQWWWPVAEGGSGALPAHPTQIYEALCYLAVFLVLMWLYYRRDAGRRWPGLMLGAGLVGIFLSRFMIEFIKNPQEAFERGMTLNMGQWLSVPFIVAGVALVWYSLRHRRDKRAAC